MWEVAGVGRLYFVVAFDCPCGSLYLGCIFYVCIALLVACAGQVLACVRLRVQDFGELLVTKWEGVSWMGFIRFALWDFISVSGRRCVSVSGCLVGSCPANSPFKQ